MSKQFKRLTMNPEYGTLASNNVALALSPDGNFLVVYLSGAAPRVWKRTGDVYNEVTGQGFTENILAADFSEDGNYLVTLSATAANRTGLWALNKTTGVFSLVKYATSTEIAIQADGVTRRLSGDYFVTFRGGVAASTASVLKINRTTTPVSVELAATYPISDINLALYNTIGVIPGKNAFMVSKRKADGIYDFALFTFNPVAGTLVLTSAVSTGLGTSAGAWDITADGRHFIAQGSSLGSQARYGDISADATSFTIKNYSSGAVMGYARAEAFSFADNVIFYGRQSGSAPFDQYAKIDPSTFTPIVNDGEVLTIADNPGAFADNLGRFILMKAPAAAKPVLAVRHLLAVTPNSISMLEEFVPSTPADLVAVAPMPDAFISTAENLTANIEALAPMPVATVMGQVNEALAVWAMAPMPDATVTAQTFTETVFRACAPMPYAEITAVGQRAEFEASAPMPDAFAQMQLMEGEFVVVAPMPDAFIITAANLSAELLASAPMPTATITTLGQRGELVAVAPMPDAFVTLDATERPSVVFFVIRKG